MWHTSRVQASLGHWQPKNWRTPPNQKILYKIWNLSRFLYTILTNVTCFNYCVFTVNRKTSETKAVVCAEVYQLASAKPAVSKEISARIDLNAPERLWQRRRCPHYKKSVAYIQGDPKGKPLSWIIIKSLNRIKTVSEVEFFTNFDYKVSTRILNVSIKYLMCDLICDVIRFCVWSCDMSKTKFNVYDKIVIEIAVKGENNVYFNIHLKDGLVMEFTSC